MNKPQPKSPPAMHEARGRLRRILKLPLLARLSFICPSLAVIEFAVAHFSRPAASCFPLSLPRRLSHDSRFAPPAAERHQAHARRCYRRLSRWARRLMPQEVAALRAPRFNRSRYHFARRFDVDWRRRHGLVCLCLAALPMRHRLSSHHCCMLPMSQTGCALAHFRRAAARPENGSNSPALASSAASSMPGGRQAD